MAFNEDGMLALIAGITRQAYFDYEDKYENKKFPDAAAFLRSCGLLHGDALDPRFVVKQRTVARQRDPLAKTRRRMPR